MKEKPSQEVVTGFMGMLSEAPGYFVQMNGHEPITNGWKLSIQGETLEHSKELYRDLLGFLIESGASFKFATGRLVSSDIPEQKHKLLTIYIPNDIDQLVFAKLVDEQIPNYKGGEKVKAPTSYNHFSGSIYYRNDRTPDGTYIAAN